MHGTVIGISGGTGTGKSALAGYLRRAGAACYSVDIAAHRLYAAGGPLAGRIVRVFGAGVEARGGGVDRGALGDAVFGSASALRKLDAMVHPVLRREALAAIARIRSRFPVVVVEAGAILFALGLDRAADRIVLTVCPRAVRLRRLVRGRGLGAAEATRRLAAFRATEARMLKAARGRRRTRVLDTGGSPARLEAAAADLMREAEWRG